MRLIHDLSLRHHRSRLPWREARRYTRHWRACQLESPRLVGDSRAASDFKECGHLVIGAESDSDTWRVGGPLDQFLSSFYECPHAIFYGKSYKSEHEPIRSGSQLWHADGGPGTCVIVMIYRSDVMPQDGPLQLVTWQRSLEIFRDEPQRASRDQLCAYYEDRIGGDYQSITGKRGTIIAFTNNTLHRGGFPAPGHSREVSIYHVYPSMVRSVAVPEKSESYPKL